MQFDNPNKRYEKESVTLTCSNAIDLQFGNNSYTKIPFDVSSSPSSVKFKLQSDGSVLVGKGVSKIAVSGAASLSGITGDQMRRLSIFKNNTIVNRTQQQLVSYQSFSLTPKIISVEEGDLISLQITGTGNPSGNASCGEEVTFLTIQEV